jgi:hypothetical protein
VDTENLLLIPLLIFKITHGCFKPPVDLLSMFLILADKYEMNFYFGLYDSGKVLGYRQYDA